MYIGALNVGFAYKLTMARFQEQLYAFVVGQL